MDAPTSVSPPAPERETFTGVSGATAAAEQLAQRGCRPIDRRRRRGWRRSRARGRGCAASQTASRPWAAASDGRLLRRKGLRATHLQALIDEILRRDAPHRGLFRITTRDTELGGIPLPAGTHLLLLFGSGNRDETAFPNPDAVDLDRPNVRDHLAFGTGLHVCPGAPMARAEIRVALEHLVQRLPGLRLTEGYPPTYIAGCFFRGLESLDVTW